jgi:hypothetical protein
LFPGCISSPRHFKTSPSNSLGNGGGREDLPPQRSNAFSAFPQTLPARTYSELFL